MPRACTICNHPNRAEINTQIATQSDSIRGIARRYSVTPDSLLRHKAAHLQPELARAEAKQEKRYGSVLDRLDWLWAQASESVVEARSAVRTVTDHDGSQRVIGRDLTCLPGLLGQAHRNVEIRGQATGELSAVRQQPQTVNYFVAIGRGEPREPRVLEVPQISSPDAENEK